MADRYIVVPKHVPTFTTLPAAESKRDAMMANNPEPSLHVLRCKTTLRADGDFQRLCELLSRAKLRLSVYEQAVTHRFPGHDGIFKEIETLLKKVNYHETP